VVFHEEVVVVFFLVCKHLLISVLVSSNVARKNFLYFIFVCTATYFFLQQPHGTHLLKEGIPMWYPRTTDLDGGRIFIE